MGGAMVRGLIGKGVLSASDVTCCDLSQACLDRMKQIDDAITVTGNSRKAVEGAGVIVLAVKPWAVQPTLESFKDLLDLERQDLVVIAAGVTFGMLSGWLGNDKAVLFRAIPNTAIEVGSSVTFVSALNADSQRTARIVELFDALGRAVLIPEDKMSAGTALASCGIAYAMRYIRAAMEGGIELGFRADEALNIVLGTVKGVADLLSASGEHPEAAIDKVTTPGGITIKGLNKMEEEGFSNAVIAGLKASQSK